MKDATVANHIVKPTSRRAADEAFVVQTHATLDDGRLAELWEAPEDAFLTTFFQGRIFLETFYRHMPANCAPIIVSVSERASGRLAMMLPLIMRETAVLRSIEAPDHGLADYVAPAMAKWFDPDADQMTKLWEQILKSLPKADILTLKKIPAFLPGGRVNPLTVLSGTVLMGTGTKTLALADVERKDHYRRTRLYKDSMRNLRRLKETGEVEFQITKTSKEASTLFDHMLRQHLVRFEALDRVDPLAEPWVQEFYRDLVMKGAPAGQVLFVGLHLDGRCLSTDLSLLEGDTCHRILTALESGEFERYSPGTIGFMLTLDEARNRGIPHYDLGVGELGYKKRLSGAFMELYERHDALSARGQVAVLEAWGRRLIRHGVGRYPKLRGPAETVRQKLRRLRA